MVPLPKQPNHELGFVALSLQQQSVLLELDLSNEYQLMVVVYVWFVLLFVEIKNEYNAESVYETNFTALILNY